LNKIRENNPDSKAFDGSNVEDIDTKTTISVEELCKLTSIKKDDVVSTLQVCHLFLLFI
jgi:homoserine trans-succinylase